MQGRKNWNREQLLVAFNLYCKLPFGKLHSRNPEIIKYAELIKRTPSALAMKLTNIASLDPLITSTGRKGLSGASLADKTMWDEMQSDWQNFVDESEDTIKALKNNALTVDENSLDDLEQKQDYTGLTKEAKVKVRVGQAFFRKSILSAYNERCCISGLSVPEMLVASHIVPWRTDEKNRLNPKNGILLSMLHDKAFDMGVITIDPDWNVVVSECIRPTNDSFFENAIKSYEGRKIAMPDKFYPAQEFLDFHRKNIFIS